MAEIKEWTQKQNVNACCLILFLTCWNYIMLNNVMLYFVQLLLWQDIASDLRSKRSMIAETEQNLRLTKNSCDNMATKFQYHCPDIERQEADVQKLNKRFNNLTKQTDTRWEGQSTGVLSSTTHTTQNISWTCTDDLHTDLSLFIAGLKACREPRCRTRITAMIMTIWTAGCHMSQTTSPGKLMTQSKWRPNSGIKGWEEWATVGVLLV